MTIAERIVQARQRLKLTQQQLAEQLCVTNKAVSKWERGTCMPDVALLVPLCRILGITVQELLDSHAEDYEMSYRACISKEDYKENISMPMHMQNHWLYVDLNTRTPSSPYVFGHNLEHTRGCIGGGLSAQMLRNRKFAGRPSCREGVSAEWFGIGRRAFFYTDMYYAHQDHYTCHYTEGRMHRRNEVQAQSVQNLAEHQECGIGQSGLTVQTSHRYELALVAKCSSPVELHVRLTDRYGSAVYAETTFHMKKNEWTRYETVLESVSDDTDACIHFTFDEYALVSFGVVSMLPVGHFRGMRTDVVEKLKEIGVGMLRWPGGNFAGEYRWMDMFLPVDQRAPLQACMEDETQPYSHGYDMHEIDTDDFIALCREIGAEPYMTINLCWNTPEESAAWVEYCNGSTDTPYGKRRAERGHAEPYNVKFWSLGNEMGYGHMEGPMTPEHYTTLASAHAEAMLGVSPDLILCTSGPYPKDNWLEKSANVIFPTASYVSYHHYNQVVFDYTTPESIRNSYQEAISAPSKCRTVLRHLHEQLPDGMHISFDEWNCWAAWFRPSSTVEGMYCAEMLHLMLYESGISDAPIVCYFEPINEGMIDVKPDRAELSADGQASAFLKAHKGGELCKIEGLQDHEAVATVSNHVLTVSLLNTDYSESTLFSLNRCGMVLCAKVLTASDLLPHSHFDEREIAYTVSDDAIRVEVPARSVAMLRIALPR